jgi:long-chain fatty acid transport protein
MRQGVYLGVLFVCLCTWAAHATAQGIMAPSAGPINSAMAGASTAAPIEFGGSFWNPAILSGLSSHEFLLGSALIFPEINLQSTIPAGSILGKFPATTRTGTARSSSGVGSNLATGFSFRLTDDSPLTMGLGVFGLVGGGVNFGGNPTQPLLTPHLPPKSFGFGPIYSDLALLSINPMISYQFTDKLAIGGGPVITSGGANFNPAFFAGTPGPLGLPTFPAATNSHPFWGAGFQLGMLYEVNEDWNVGFSYKSPVWQQRWEYNASFKDLSARTIGIQASLPATYSWGVAYKGLPGALIDVDLRYIDYANAQLFGPSVTSGGLGWRSVFAVATGVQYALTERLTLRGGYLFNTNPIPAPVTLFNVQAPAITQHTLSLGASFALTENITLTTAWVHAFDNSIQGPILEVPGSSARLTTQVDSIVAGINFTFGGRRKVAIPVAAPTGATTAPMDERPLLPPLPPSSAGSTTVDVGLDGTNTTALPSACLDASGRTPPTAW